MNKVQRTWRAIVHGAIRRYLIRCAGVFHTGHFGLYGHYVVLMTDAEYALWKVGKRPGLMSVYKDGDAFFLALPDFSNLQASPAVFIERESMARLLAENARNQEEERLFWEALDGKVEWK